MTDRATLANRAYRAGFEAGLRSGLAWPSPPRPRDPAHVRLDEAQAKGPRAYNAERRRQGLVEYDPRGVDASWRAFAEAGHERV